MRISSVWLAALLSLAALEPADGAVRIASREQDQDEPKAPKACALTETLGGCLRRVWTDLDKLNAKERELARKRLEAAKKKAATDAPRLLQGEPVGGIDPGLRNSIKDFLPPFAGGFTLPKEGDGGDLVSEYTFNAVGGRAKVKGTLASPEPYKPLLEKVEKSARADAAKAIGEDTRPIDDVSAEVSWTPVTKYWGRSLGPHGDLLDTLLVAIDPPTPSPLFTIAEYVSRFGQNIDPGMQADAECIPTRGGSRPLKCVTEEFRNEVFVGIQVVAQASVKDAAAFQDTLETSGYFMLPYLANNQQQVSLTYRYHHTRGPVGPRQHIAEITYETGGLSIGDLRAQCDTAATANLPACVQRFVRDSATVNALRSAIRFAWHATLTRSLTVNHALPEFNASLIEPARTEVKGGLTLGQFIGVPDEGTENAHGRIEAGLDFVHHSDDGLRNKNRVVGSLSYTHRIGESTSVTTGIVAATRSEFRGDVDWPLGARAGLKYKFISKKK